MLPAIFPRDEIHARPARPADLVPGAIIGFPDGKKQVVAHRIIRVQEREGGRWLEVRGDAQRVSEWIPVGAAALVVVAVHGRLGRWSVDGRRGRWLRAWALSTRPLPMALKHLSVAGVHWTASARARIRDHHSR